MDTETKRSIYIRMVFSVILIVSLIAVTVSASFSWFLFNNPNHVNDVNVEVTKAFNLKLYDATQSGEIIGSNLDDDFRLKPIYGDGRDFFVLL